ncbi:MAG: 2-oxoglutarate dehydrogenase E1 component, partial [Candidatus Latescibacterota bacterium]
MSVLRDSFRRWGHLQADLDPLGRLAPLPCAELDEARGGEADRLRKIYCGSIGAEFMHIPDPERREWVARRLEEEPAEPDRSFILKRLAMTEVFELFLHSRYVGTKRFSIEGCTALIPALDSILESAGAEGVKSVLIAMSHRGRLNVMAHIVGTPDAKIFAGFEDVNPRSVLVSVDLRHHLGATGTYTTRAGEALHVHLVANPSHLEAVSPVVMGRARARQQRIGTEGIREVLPITIHGDASLAGQGIAAEALNLAFLPGYRVGGTVHVVVNNLVGFTTEPVSLHSSRYATDVALRLPIPILHVNGEDMAAVDRAGRILHGYRHRFESDVMLDLYGFRRYGHSEVDDPTT